MNYSIRHNRNLNREAGYVDITDVDRDWLLQRKDAKGRPIADNREKAAALDAQRFNPLADGDRHTLLYFLFWVTYTWEGRQICREYQAGRAHEPRDEAHREDRPVLQGNPNDAYYDNEKIKRELGEVYARFVGTGPILDALLEVHISAGEWTYLDQKRLKDESDMKRLEMTRSRYQMATSVVMWKLWEDLQDHEFSMAW